ncbi:MAG: COG1361 S-layer family protein [Candidatus Woesearchaeota archaeon]
MKKITIIMLALIMLMPLAIANPVPNVELATQNPLPARQGSTVDVTINIQNIGSADIRNMEVEIVDSNFIKLLSEQQRKTNVPILGSFKDFSRTYTFLIEENTPDGTNFIDVKLISQNNRVITNKRVPIQVGTTTPTLTVTSVNLEPQNAAPGQEFKLTIGVRNDASAVARDVSVALDLEPLIAGNAIIRDLPFTTINMANTKKTARINQGQISYFEFNLLTFPEATSRVYKLPININFEDEQGNQMQQNVQTAITINGEPNLIIDIDQTNINKNQRTGDITFIVINTGLTDLKTTTIKVEESENFNLLTPGRLQYLGNIDSDDFDTVRYRFQIPEGDNVQIPLTLNYKDALNNDFEETFQVTLNLHEGSQNGSGSLIAIILILAVTGFIYYRYKKKQNQQEE